MPVPEAVWCLVCGAVPDVAVTIERNGVLAHYGACWEHVGEVTARARRETAAPTPWRLAGPQAPATATGAIEAQADE